MTQTNVAATVLAGVLLAAAPVLAASSDTLRVLVTNDDGVAAPGIDALVMALTANPNLQVTVVAPATNQSGTGDNKTTASTLPVAASMTAGGYPATAVSGFPADAALFGIRQVLSATPPDLVVSGINLGQNYTGDIIPLSGTVGAAFWSARLGIPAFAVSASLSTPDYAGAAAYTATLVEQFRASKGFRKKMLEKEVPFHGLVLNVNYPTCTTGSTVRGARVVAVDRLTKITGYTETPPSSGNWQPNATTGNYSASDCTSVLEEPETDLEAWNNGFVAVSPLDADRSVSGRKLKHFGFLEKLF